MFGLSIDAMRAIELLPNAALCRHYKLCNFLLAAPPAVPLVESQSGCARAELYSRREHKRGVETKMRAAAQCTALVPRLESSDAEKDDVSFDVHKRGQLIYEEFNMPHMWYRRLSALARERTQVVKSHIQGWGLCATQSIGKGEMVCALRSWLNFCNPSG